VLCAGGTDIINFSFRSYLYAGTALSDMQSRDVSLRNLSYPPYGGQHLEIA